MATLQRVPPRQYRAGEGAGFDDKAAARYGRFLERKAGLGKRPVPPEEIEALAVPEDSPIHERFTWDVDRAAYEYRLEEARHLIRCIYYVEGVGDEEVVSRAFHNVTVSNGDTVRGYVSDRIVWARPELAEQVIAKALRELDGWRKRYRSYSELASVVAKVDEVLEEAA